MELKVKKFKFALSVFPHRYAILEGDFLGHGMFWLIPISNGGYEDRMIYRQ
jgi:hypothetical protein